MDGILRLLLNFGMAVLLFLRPLISGLVYPWSNTLFLIWIIFLWFVWFLRSIFNGQIVSYKAPTFYLHLIFLVGVGISWNYSLNPYDGIQFAMNMITAILTGGLIIQAFREERQVLALIGVILVTASLVSFFGLYQFFFGLQETRAWAEAHLPMKALSDSFKSRLASPRIFSTLIYPNALAGYLLNVLPFAVAILWLRRKRFHFWIIFCSACLGALIFILFERPVYVVGVVLLSFLYPLLYLVTFLLTLSKGGLATFFFIRLLGYFCFYRFVPMMIRRFYLWLIFLVESVLAGVLIFNLPEWIDRLWPSFEVRWEHWNAACAIVKDFPLWGTGPGTFGSVYAHYKLPGAEETRMAHNNFLQVFAESGVVAGIAFLSIWLIPFLKGLNARLKCLEVSIPWKIVKTGSFLGIAAFLIHGLVDFDLYEPGIAVNAWVFLALFHDSHKAMTINVQTTFKKIFGILFGQLMVMLIILGLRRHYVSENYFSASQQARLQGNAIAALTFVERTLKENSFNPQAHFLRGMLLEDMKDASGAIAEYEKARRLDPFNPSFPYRMALLYQRMHSLSGKNVAKIETLLREAAEDYPSSPHYHLKLAQFYESVGRRDDALIEYRTVRKLGMDTRKIRNAISQLKKQSTLAGSIPELSG